MKTNVCLEGGKINLKIDGSIWKTDLFKQFFSIRTFGMLQMSLSSEKLKGEMTVKLLYEAPSLLNDETVD